MAGKTTAKSKVKNGVNKKESVMSMTYIDDILLRLDKAEENIDDALEILEDIDLGEIKQSHREIVMRVEKVEARLGIG